MKYPSRLALIVFSALAAAPLPGCGPGDSSGAAPNFVLQTPEGKSVSLSSFKGRPVVLNFWATWCEACQEELPVLRKLREGAQDYDLLAVDVDDDPAKVVPPFARSNGMDFPILYADRRTMDAYAVRMLPTTFLIGPDGAILRRYVGPLDSRAIENDILSLLKRRPS